MTQYGYTYTPPQPPPAKDRTMLWVSLVIGAIIVLAAVTALSLRSSSSESVPVASSTSTTTSATAEPDAPLSREDRDAEIWDWVNRNGLNDGTATRDQIATMGGLSCRAFDRLGPDAYGELNSIFVSELDIDYVTASGLTREYVRLYCPEYQALLPE